MVGIKGLATDTKTRENGRPLSSIGSRLTRLPASARRLERPAKQRIEGCEQIDERPRWWRDRRRRRMLATADSITALAIGTTITLTAGESPAWALPAVSMGVLGAKLFGLYDTDHRVIRHLTVDELPTIAAWSGLLVVATLILISGSVGGAVPFLALVALAVGLATALRALARYAWRRATPPESTLVVGTGAPAHAIARKIELFDDMHLELDRVEDPAIHLEHRNGDEDAAMNRALRGVDRVILAWEDAHPRFIERLLGHCRRLEVKLSVISPFRGRARPAGRLSQVADLPVLEYNTWDPPRSTVAIKRAVDLVAAGALLIVTAPLIGIIALAIKLDDRGPVFFRQPRAGKGAVPFTIIKFRSMCVDAEERLSHLVDLDDLEQPMFKIVDDPRVTRVGRVLRRFSLDELPQLLNVALGQMSLVGPRPEHLAVTDRYLPEHAFRLAVKPGVSGPMQVFGRGDLSFEERLAVEIDYVENVSISRDLSLLMQTVPAVIRGTGAY